MSVPSLTASATTLLPSGTGRDGHAVRPYQKDPRASPILAIHYCHNLTVSVLTINPTEQDGPVTGVKVS
jgi:hypothetical protein